jgi:hypothetical protein
MFLTTDAVIVDSPKKDSCSCNNWWWAGAMGGMWWMDMY